MHKPTIGISIGDINGIGPEVILKTLQHPDITSLFTPIIYGSSKAIAYHKNIAEADLRFTTIREAEEAGHHRVNVLNCWNDTVNIQLGEATVEGGQFAAIALERAVLDLKEGKIDALVTAPINKHAMQQTGGFPFPGHTEYITKVLEADESLMLMVQDELRIGLVTNHLPLEDVSKNISRKQVNRKLQIMHDTLRMDFDIEKPKIAVLGLNPHAGDNGLLGNAEDKVIRPVIVEAKKKGMIVTGPFSADGFFGSGQYRKYDAILAMYHDQGLIPFKLLSFGQGVNYTAGLSAIRTSPDHGTAYDLAGKNAADPSSFRQALYRAIDIARNRRNFLEMNENPLQPSPRSGAQDDQEERIPEEA